MIKSWHFLLGFVLAGIYLIGIGAVGYILYEHYQTLYPIVALGLFALIPINLVVFYFCPSLLKWGSVIPQLIALGIVTYFIGNKEVAPFFTDDIAYRSCVGNFDHGEGISDCTALIFKLENEGAIKLKEIENTKGDYWLAEMLSYRGRHYIRNDQFKFGKEDFARAFLLPEGAAVVAGNLAEAGFTRQDMFEADYEKEFSVLKQLVTEEKIASKEAASNFLIAQLESVVELCSLSTGREKDNCQQLIEEDAFKD